MANALNHPLDLSDQDFAKVKERSITALHYMKQALDYRIESARLASATNEAATKALAAGKSYTESVERALETENRLAAGDTVKLGLRIGTPINTSIKDVISRSSKLLSRVLKA